MKHLFSYLYAKTMRWSGRPNAAYFLAGVSFAESSFFPIPPDVMLIGMGLARPMHAWRNALIATIFSVCGGLFGYLIGYYSMALIEPYLLASSYGNTYTHVVYLFQQYGVWIVIVAGFTPLPYKIFTITAGALHMPFAPFVIGSMIGRGARFFLVSALLFFLGERIETHLRRYIDTIGWSLLSIALIVCVYLKWIH